MVEGFIGLPGAGKTYLLAKKGLEDIALGKEVYANFSLEGAKRFTNLKQIVDLIKEKVKNKEPVNMTLLIDEINLSFPSRMWTKVPPWVLYFFSQSRKFGLDIYYTSQALARVDKVIREITNFVWIVKPFLFGFHRARKIMPEDNDRVQKEIYKTKYFKIEEKVYS
ncbi:MAG: zonular occludens toxin domain-containing protein, partial [Endomicrobiaceae bacterium]|nr:zonular occludens toxin domain-containing protein [Endomicrobiaceae bacterium]